MTVQIAAKCFGCERRSAICHQLLSLYAFRQIALCVQHRRLVYSTTWMAWTLQLSRLLIRDVIGVASYRGLDFYVKQPQILQRQSLNTKHDILEGSVLPNIL